MAIVALTNSSSPVTVERATADDDPYERETQLNGLALNFDDHDHTSAKGLGVGRVQTGTAPAASGQVRANGDAWQWWGATAGAVRTALDLEGAQTVSGAKTLSSTLLLAPGAGSDALVANGAIRVLGANNTGLQLSSRDTGAAGFLLHGQAGNFYIYDLVKPGNRITVDPAGTLILTPDATAVALSGGSPDLKIVATNNIRVNPSGAERTFCPDVHNTISCGYNNPAWSVVYAVNGTIQTSSQEYKEGIRPLDPAACAQAVVDTDWVGFDYKPPVFTEPAPGPGVDEASPDVRTARVAEARAAFERLLEETAPARRQKGFVLGSPEHKVADLFGLSDRRSASPSSDLAVVACALQHVLRRMEALEGAAP